MSRIFVAVALLVVIALIVLGITSEVADAAQAQAAIEAARAAQIAAAGQAATSTAMSFVTMLLVAALLGMIALCIWLVYVMKIKPEVARQQVGRGRAVIQPRNVQTPQLSSGEAVNLIIQAQALQALAEMNRLQRNSYSQNPARPALEIQAYEEDDVWAEL